MAKSQPNRIPAEQLLGFERWSLPDMDGEGAPIKSAEKERRERARIAEQQSAEVIEDVDDVVLEPLTAERLQEITDEAIKDGYAQGHSEGLAAGKEEGYRAGEAQGMQEMKASLQQQQQRFAALADVLFNPLQEQDEALERALVDAVMALTTSVVKRELYADSSHIVSIVNEAIEALPAGVEKVSLALNPEDLELVEQFAKTYEKRWHCVADESMAPGGVRVNTANSDVNFSSEQRLKQVLKQFMNKQLATTQDNSATPLDHE